MSETLFTAPVVTGVDANGPVMRPVRTLEQLRTDPAFIQSSSQRRRQMFNEWMAQDVPRLIQNFTPEQQQQALRELPRVYNRLVPTADASIGTRALDIGRQAGSGIATGTASLIDAFSPNAAPARFLRETAEGLQQGLSPFSQNLELQAQENRPVNGSFLEEAGAALGDIYRRPLQSAARIVGSAAPALATSAIPVVGPIAALGVGATQGVGDVRAQQYQAAMNASEEQLRSLPYVQDLLRNGLTIDQARQELATRVDVPATALAALAGLIQGRLAAGVAGRLPAESTLRPVLQRSATSLTGNIAEGVGQGLAGAVGQQVATNLGEQTVDPNIPTGRGLGEAAVIGTAAGALFGVPTGLRARREGEAARIAAETRPPTEQAATPEVTPTAPAEPVVPAPDIAATMQPVTEVVPSTINLLYESSPFRSEAVQAADAAVTTGIRENATRLSEALERYRSDRAGEDGRDLAGRVLDLRRRTPEEAESLIRQYVEPETTRLRDADEGRMRSRRELEDVITARQLLDNAAIETAADRITTADRAVTEAAQRSVREFLDSPITRPLAEIYEANLNRVAPEGSPARTGITQEMFLAGAQRAADNLARAQAITRAFDGVMAGGEPVVGNLERLTRPATPTVDAVPGDGASVGIGTAEGTVAPGDTVGLVNRAAGSGAGAQEIPVRLDGPGAAQQTGAGIDTTGRPVTGDATGELGSPARAVQLGSDSGLAPAATAADATGLGGTTPSPARSVAERAGSGRTRPSADTPAEAVRAVETRQTETALQSSPSTEVVGRRIDSLPTRERRYLTEAAQREGYTDPTSFAMAAKIAQSTGGSLWSRLRTQVRQVINKITRGIAIIATALSLWNAVPINDAVAQTGMHLRTPVVETAGIRSPVLNELNTWIRQSRDNQGQRYLLADKAEGVLYVMSPEGRVMDSTPALFGRDTGDARQVGQTPAGRFELRRAYSPSAAYGESIQTFLDTPSGTYSIHRVLTTNPAERRVQRLETGTGAERRISNGCINVPEAFYDQYLTTNFRGHLYVAPDAQGNLGTITGQQTPTGLPAQQESRQRMAPSRRSRRQRGEPEAQDEVARVGEDTPPEEHVPAVDQTAVREMLQDAPTNLAEGAAPDAQTLAQAIEQVVAPTEPTPRIQPAVEQTGLSEGAQRAAQAAMARATRMAARNPSSPDAVAQPVSDSQTSYTTRAMSFLNDLVSGRREETPRSFADVERFIDTGQFAKTERGASIPSRIATFFADATTPFVNAIEGDKALHRSFELGNNRAIDISTKALDEYDRSVSRLAGRLARQNRTKASTLEQKAALYRLARYAADGNTELRSKLESRIRDANERIQDLTNTLQSEPNNSELINALLEAKRDLAVAQERIDNFDAKRGEIRGEGQRMALEESDHFVGGLTDAEGQALVAKMDAQPDAAAVRQLAEEMGKPLQRLVRRALDEGVISPEEFSHYSTSDWFVPTTGVDDGIHILSRSFEREGRSSVSDNPAKTIREAIAALGQRIGRNDFVNRLYDAAQEGKYGLEIVPASDPRQGVFFRRVSDGQMTQGKITMDNPEAMAALTGTNRHIVESDAARKLGNYTRNFSFLVTRALPTFAPINALRDIGERVSNIVSNSGERVSGTRLGLQAYAGYLPALRDAINAMRGNLDSQGAKDFAAFRDMGGITTKTNFLRSGGIDAVRERIERASGNRLGTRALDAINNYNEAFESAAAYSVYKALRSQGIEPERAAGMTLQAMNLNRSGTHTAFMQMLYPFVGARAVGAQQVVKSLRTPRGIGALTAQIALGMGLYSAMQGIAGDDEDGNRLDNVQATSIQRSIPLFTNGNEYVKLPVPYGIPQIAWNIAVALSRVNNGRWSPSDAMEHIAASTADEVALPGTPPPADMRDNPGWYAGRVFTPEILKRVLNVAMNRNDFGSPLNRPFLDPHAPRSEQGRTATPSFWTDAAKAAFQTLGLDYTPEEMAQLTATFIPPIEAMLRDAERPGPDGEEGPGVAYGIGRGLVGGNRLTGQVRNALQSQFFDRQRDILNEERAVRAQLGVNPEDFRAMGNNAMERMARLMEENGIDPAVQQRILTLYQYESARRSAQRTGGDTDVLMRQFLEQTQ